MSSIIKYIPNLLTLVRLALVPLFLVLLQNKQYLASLLIFLAAGFSDALDGFIAKRFNAQSNLGAILDPLADKVLLVSSYVMLSYLHLIPFWLAVIVVFRDLLIVGGYLVYVIFFGVVQAQPIKISKLNTFLQIIFILLVLTSLAWQVNMGFVQQYLAYAIFITSLISGLSYVWMGVVKAMQHTEVSDQANN